MTCSRINKLFRGCKFEPRYSNDAAQTEKLRGLELEKDEPWAPLLETVRNKVYEGDICVRCGKFVKKEA